MIVIAGKAASGTGSGTRTGAVQIVEAGGVTFTMMTLQKGDAPTATTEGDRVRIGDQTIAYDGKRIVFGK